jgi:hypothetical protein
VRNIAGKRGIGYGSGVSPYGRPVPIVTRTKLPEKESRAWETCFPIRKIELEINM